MGDYQPNEIVDIIKVIGLCNHNYKSAEREYARLYPDRRHPTNVTMKRLDLRAQQGHLKRRRRKSGVNEQNTIVTLGAAIVDPQISSREIQRIHGIPRTTALTVLKLHKFHAYHITSTQKLLDADFNRRLAFCNWAQNKLLRDPQFFLHVLFTDEATFNNAGGLNRHNCHYWSDLNPHWQRGKELQHQWSINVWGGIVGKYVIGPYFFEGRLNGNMYTNFLRKKLPALLEDVDLNTRSHMWFQQDGAPAHTSAISRNFLNIKFPNKLIGIGSRIQEWPPRSPDLTPLDFFLWGYVKDKVFAEEPTTVLDMKQRIREAFGSITANTLLKVQQSFEHRLRLCIHQNGRVFEHLRN